MSITMAEELENDERLKPCLRNHGSSMLVRTSQSGILCLKCFADLITSPSSLVVRKEIELREFTESLADSQFCSDFIRKRPELLAAPLAEAIFFTADEGLASAIIDVTVAVCKLVLDTLLQDTMLHICLHLSTSETTPWKHGHLFCVRALSLLLDLHCHHNNHIPNAITSQAGCVQNFVKAISLPFRFSDEAGANIFFIFVKLASLEGGIKLLAEYCPSLVLLSVRALEETQNDVVRTNCLDLLTALAQASVFNISLSTTAFDGQRDTSDPDMTAQPCQTNATFVGQFAEAMKASLLSPDTHVQIRSLVLIDKVCPTSLDIGEELHSLVKEGLTDYIFEVLRVSGDLDSVGSCAIQTLVTLSLASHSFSDHFGLGLEPLLRVLEHSFSSAYGDLQKDTLSLISAGIDDRPGVISCTLAEHLMHLLKKSFQCYSRIVKDHAISEILGFGLSSEALNATCGTLITLLRTPSFCNIPSICQMLQDCVSALTDCISADPIYASQHHGIISAARLLQAAHCFCVQQNFAHEQFRELAQFLMTHFHLRILPVVEATFESISEEETIDALFSTVRTIVQDGESIQAGELARTLISKYWVSMAFESMSKFPSEDLKQNIYSTIGTMINRTSPRGDLIQDDILRYLPADVEGLLRILEQRSQEDSHLIAAHRAIISLLFTSMELGDRLAESNQLLSSLETHVLVNSSSSLLASASSPVVKQFLLLFIEGQENIISQGRFPSVQAEIILIDTLQTAYHSGYLNYEMPLPALKWIIERESLSALSKELLLKHLDAGAEVQVAQLIGEDDYATEVLMSLFVDVVGRHLVNEIRIVATGLSSIIKGSWSFAQKFHSHGVVKNLRRFILVQGCEAPEATVTACVELLFQLLFVLDESMAAMDEGAWLDIASQTEKLLLLHLRNGRDINAFGVPLVNLIALIMHKSISIPSLREPARKVFVSIELRDTLERIIVIASQKVSAVTSMDGSSDYEMSLRASLIFHTVWLRCGICNVIREETNRVEHSFSNDFSQETTSRISYQHLCQLLCFSTHSIQTLASSCLVEHLSHTLDAEGKLRGNLAESSVNDLRSMTLILQGAALGRTGLLRTNACMCMMGLLATTVLDLKQNEAITRSPWYKTVAAELLLSVALVHVGVKENEGIQYFVSILSALLCFSPPYDWLPSVFNSQALKAAVESMKSTQHVTAGTVDFFLELQRRGFLGREEVETLSELYQTVRRKCYRGRSTRLEVNVALAGGVNSESFLDTISNLEGDIRNMDSANLILHLTLNNTREHLFELRAGEHSSELNNESLLLAKIDEFLHGSV